MITKTAKTITVSIYIAGDLEEARRVCRAWCFEIGGCVTIEPVEFVYTGGAETGVRVGFINYPRFPTEEDAMMNRAISLGTLLMEKLMQNSFSIEGASETIWFSRRKGDQK